MIRNIVFDMGNVMIRFDPEFFITREGIQDENDRKTILKELFQSVEWAQMDLGVLTEDSAEPSVLARIPARLHEKTIRLLRSWAFPVAPIPGMEELVRRLKAAGYKVFLLSNASVSQHDYWPKIPVSNLFDGKLISCDVKTVKPCPEIYRMFTEKFGLDAEECIFIDDSPANVAGACACGWKGFVFHGDAAEAETKLRASGVNF